MSIRDVVNMVIEQGFCPHSKKHTGKDWQQFVCQLFSFNAPKTDIDDGYNVNRCTLNDWIHCPLMRRF